jgi:hypothetical protein
MSQVQIHFYGDPCRSCGYGWHRASDSLLADVLELERTYRRVLDGVPGTARHPELTWCASAYVLHVADNLRIHGERMAGAAAGGEPPVFDQPNQDELSELRMYEKVPIEGALWSLDSVLAPYVAAYLAAAATHVELPHPVRGTQVAIDVLRGNVHDAHHHAWDLGRIVVAHRAASAS